MELANIKIVLKVPDEKHLYIFMTCTGREKWKGPSTWSSTTTTTRPTATTYGGSSTKAYGDTGGYHGSKGRWPRPEEVEQHRRWEKEEEEEEEAEADLLGEPKRTAKTKRKAKKIIVTSISMQPST
uniref:Uncharacterized protein n=1 Tax=Oryza brachyantha TaxID=4533 RepID=J3L858_ORYBR